MGKRVEFTPNSATISKMEDNSQVVVGEVNHHSRLYTFSKFVAKSDSTVLLTHANVDSKIWHEIFGHLNVRCMQQLSKQGMVKGFPNIQYSDGVYQGCILGKNPHEKI